MPGFAVVVNSKTSTQSLTRPNNSTQYSANDAISTSTSAGTVLTFSGVGRTTAGSGTIVQASCVSSANKATKPSLALYLFSSPPTAVNDADAFTVTDAELRNCVAVLNFPTFVAADDASDASGNCRALSTEVGLVYKCGTDLQVLYGLVKVLNAYTPVAQERFDFTLNLYQD